MNVGAPSRTEERAAVVERAINAEPVEIFAILTDPSKHRTIDGSDMLNVDPTGRCLASPPR